MGLYAPAYGDGDGVRGVAEGYGGDDAVAFQAVNWVVAVVVLRETDLVEDEGVLRSEPPVQGIVKLAKRNYWQQARVLLELGGDFGLCFLESGD
jgi:hypothetical protein